MLSALVAGFSISNGLVISCTTGITVLVDREGIKPADREETRPADIEGKKTADTKGPADIEKEEIRSADGKGLANTEALVGTNGLADAEALLDAKSPAVTERLADTEELVIIYYKHQY